MIELHSHVLPGLDDGAADVDESRQMLVDYAAQGVKTIVCTPHIYPSTFTTPDTLEAFLDARDERLAQLQTIINVLNIDVTLHLGAEVMLTTRMLPYLHDQHLAARLTINGGSYLLVELPAALPGGLQSLEGLLFEIQLSGFLPILAHPERTAHNEEIMMILKRWVDSGRILLQANAGHLVDDIHLDPTRKARYMRRRGVLQQMIREGMIHFIASDAHSVKMRPCQHFGAFGVVRDMFGEKVAMRLLVDNPRCVVEDSIVQVN